MWMDAFLRSRIMTSGIECTPHPHLEYNLIGLKCQGFCLMKKPPTKVPSQSARIVSEKTVASCSKAVQRTAVVSQKTYSLPTNLAYKYRVTYLQLLRLHLKLKIFKVQVLKIASHT